MKKVAIYCTILAMMLFSSVLYAGEVGEIHYGVKGGIGLAKLWGDDASGLDFRLGANAGAFMNYCVHEMLVLQPEAFYAMKGFKVSSGGTDLTAAIDYIDIDVLAKLTIPMEGMVKPCVFAGPYVGINISSDFELGDFSGEIENIKTTDFGAVIGGGVDIVLENGVIIVVDVRYSLGLAAIADDPDEDMEVYLGSIDGEAPDVKNNSIIFMAGVAF